jgi:hypothetical protein
VAEMIDPSLSFGNPFRTGAKFKIFGFEEDE